MSYLLKKIAAFMLFVVAAISGIFGIGNQPTADLTIELKANPTTGYEWVVSMDKEDVVKLEKREYKQSVKDPTIVGAGGTETFCFKAVGDGTVKITFTYCRPWEENKDAARTVTYTCVSSNGKIAVLNTTEKTA